MDNFNSPLGNTIPKKLDSDNSKYFVEYNNQPAFPVLSPYDGIVTFTRESDSGYTIKLRHKINNEELECTIENLSTLYVSNGQQVYKEQKIGLTGKNRIKVFIKNKTKNTFENPKDWIKGTYVSNFESTTTQKEKKSNSKDLTTSKTKETNISTDKFKIDQKASGPESILALPFSALGSGLKSIFRDAEKTNKEREERKEKSKLEIELKKQEKKKKEENDDDLATDIQFEETTKKIVLEEIERIKKLMK